MKSKTKAVKHLYISQVAFLAGIFMCVLIKPDIALDNRALSLYGTFAVTIAPYALGTLLSALFIYRAALYLPEQVQTNRSLARYLIVLSMLLTVLVASPYTVNVVFFWVHAVTSFSIFIADLLLGFWLILKTRENHIDTVAFVSLCIGFTISTLSIGWVNVIQLLTFGQLLTVLSFAVLLTRSVERLERELPGQQG